MNNVKKVEVLTKPRIMVPPRTLGDNFSQNISRRSTSPKSHIDQTDKRRIEGSNFINYGPIPHISRRKHSKYDM